MLVGAVLRRSVARVLAPSLTAAAVLLAAPGAASAQGFACASGGLTYSVEPGDGWFRIADRVGVSSRVLLDANGARLDDLLVPGDLLCLPGNADLADVCVGSYRVRSGDSWYGISARVGVRPAALVGANGGRIDRVIFPGEELCLPEGATVPDESSRSAGGSSEIATSDATASPTGGTYTVRTGDSWYLIARRVEVSARSLMELNGATTSTVIIPGEQIRLPAGAVRPEATGSSTPSASTSSPGTYTVRSGDSWYLIARRAQVSPAALLQINGASATSVIVPGQVIRLPAGAVQPPDPEVVLADTVELQALPTQGPCWYGDTWLDARPDQRRHVGVDIFTKSGDYVYAVVDGYLTGRAWDQPGRRSGNAWYLTAADGTWYFYAHLSAHAPGLEVGSRVQAGQILGWVGETGNAAAEHLHFEIHPKGGAPINPYPILKELGGCNRGTPYTQPGGWVPELID